jgi:hypothetical protein
MKNFIGRSLSVWLLLCLFLPLQAVESGKMRPPAKETTDVSTKKEARKEKRLARWQEKWSAAGEDLRRLTDDNNFVLGLLLLGAAIVLAILGGLGILRGLLGLISGLAALAGLALIIIALWNFYS